MLKLGFVLLLDLDSALDTHPKVGRALGLLALTSPRANESHSNPPFIACQISSNSARIFQSAPRGLLAPCTFEILFV